MSVATEMARYPLSAPIAIASMVLLTAVAPQPAREPGFSRFGPVARALTDGELAQIVDLANADGRKPWVMLGFPSMLPGTSMVSVYLEPDIVTERLRRGRLLVLVARNAGDGSGRSAWSLDDRIPYAFIPLPSHSGVIEDEEDLSLPFAVHGVIDDETLISLVTFVRSLPPLPNVPEGASPREVPRLPLASVRRNPETFSVVVRLSGYEASFGLTVARKDGRWIVTEWHMSIV